MSEQDAIKQSITEAEYAATSGTGNATIRIYNYYGYREKERVAPVKSNETATDEKLPSPYRGLFHFSPEDAEFFFGREVFVKELVQATQTRNFIPVLGASGSGKSSVVFAGLVPKLQKEGHWKFTHFRPGAVRTKEQHSIVDPFYALATALVPVYEPDLDTTDQLAQASKLAEYLRSGTILLSDVITKFQHNYPQHRLLVIADQFEELYTLCQDDKLRRNFLDKLLDSIDSPIPQAKSPLVLVATMRVDFLGDALSYSRFGDALRNADIKIRAMNREELSQVVEEPSQKLGVMFEAGLVERILNDVENEPGNLPLLEFALTLLWEQRQGNQLTHAAYVAIGQVKGALTSYAERKYGQLNSTEQEQVRRIFIQLVRPGEGTEDTRRLATKSELGDARWSLVQQLATDRLVVTSRNATNQETVEVVHEALIGNWSQLRQWMAKDRLFRAWQERLRMAMRQWEETQRDEEALLRGALLAEAEEKLKERPEDLCPSEQSFIRQSIKQKNERRNRQRLLASITTCFFAGFALFSGFQWRNSEINQIGALRASSEALFVSNQKLDALISSLRAGKKLNQPLLQIFPPSPKLRDEVKATLHKVVYQVQERNRLKGGDNASEVGVSFSPHGQHLATAGNDGTVRLWNLQGQILKEWTEPSDTTNSIMSFSPDGQLLATLGITNENNMVRLWNLQGQMLEEWKADQGWLDPVSFSPDGQRLVTTGERGMVHLWDLQGNKLKEWKAHEFWIWRNSFSPDGQLATVGYGGYVRLWNLQGQMLKGWKASELHLRSVSFSPNSQRLATVGDDDRVCLWNLQNWQLSTELCWEGDGSGTWSVSFSPDGQLLATGGSSDTTRLWNLQGDLVAELKGKQTSIKSISFSSDGKRLATAGGGGTVNLWDLQDKQLTIIRGQQDPITNISFSPNSKQLATAELDGTVRLQDLQGNELHKFFDHQGEIESISFSPDGQQLTITGDDSTVRSWNLQGQKLLEEKFLLDVKNDFNCLEFSKKCFWFSPDRRLLAGITAQGTIHVQNLQGEKLFSSPIDPDVNNYFTGLWFSSDGRLLAGAQDHGSVYVWDLQDKSLTRFPGHPDGTNSAIFYSKNQKLATAGNDGTVRLWDLQGKQDSPFFEFTAHQAFVQSLSLSPNGQQLATAGGEDGAVRLWNFQGQQLAEFPAKARRVIFSPDNQKLATLARDGSAQVWQIETFEQLMKRGCDWVRDYLKNNPKVEESDRHLCNGIPSSNPSQ